MRITNKPLNYLEKFYKFLKQALKLKRDMKNLEENGNLRKSSNEASYLYTIIEAFSLKCQTEIKLQRPKKQVWRSVK